MYVLYLELNDYARPSGEDSGDELVHHLEVVFSLQAGMSHADIVGIIDQSLVVGAHVQGDGQDSVGGDTTGSTVQGQLTDGDAHALGSEITQAQDTTSICNHNDMHVFVGPVVNHGVEHAAVSGAEVHTTGTAEARAELLANNSHSRRVDQRS